MKSLDEFILLVEGALPVAFCDALLAEYRDADDWNATLVSSGQVNRAVRNADAISLSERAVVARNQRVRQKLDQQLLKHAVAVVKRYHLQFPLFRVNKDSGFELLRYPAGGFYREHTDSYHSIPREVACSFLLNDDFEGGEFAFFAREHVVAMPKGSALLFPANFMYPHEILPVTRGTRYSVVTWFV